MLVANHSYNDYTSFSSELDILYSRYTDWLTFSSPNERYSYYIGERLSESILGTRIGKKLMNDAENGKVYLFQRKINNGMYDHIAIKASYPPVKRLVPSKRNQMEFK